MPSSPQDRRTRISKRSQNLDNAKRVVTLRVPTVLDQNIEAFSITQGKLKSEIIIEAISAYLVSKNLQPTKPPRLSLSY